MENVIEEPIEYVVCESDIKDDKQETKPLKETQTMKVSDVKINNDVKNEEVKPSDEKENNNKPLMNQERKIKYDVMMMRPNNAKPLLISFDDVDKYDFSKKVFIEFIISEDYVHLYFDFDSISSMNELDDVIQWLDSLKPVFGEYSIGGYTDNVDVNHKYHFRLLPDGNHYVSMHVVYYQTMISTNDLQSIMKHTAKTGFNNKRCSSIV